MNKEQRNGHLALAGANMMWGMMAPISKYVMSAGLVGSLILTDVRIFGAAVLFWITSFFVKHEKVEKRDFIRLFFASLFAIVLNQGVYITGVSMTSPVDASIITTSLPIVAMIISAFYLKEPVTAKKVGGVLLGAAGALLLVFGNNIVSGNMPSVSGTGTESNLLGDLLCFLAQCSYAIYIVVFKDLIGRYSPVTLMKWMFTFASLVMIPFTIKDFIATPWQTLPLDQYSGVGFVLFCGTFLCYMIVPIGQRSLRPTLVAMYNYMQPIVSTLIAVLWGMDRFNLLKIVAIFLVFSGVFLVNSSKARN